MIPKPGQFDDIPIPPIMIAPGNSGGVSSLRSTSPGPGGVNKIYLSPGNGGGAS